jgi:methylenetetrahydrofolate reductase (NADPH)
MKAQSRLKQTLQNGVFAVTAECGPPKGADPKVIQKKGKLLKGFVDSVNVTDNQTGVVRLPVWLPVYYLQKPVLARASDGYP